MSKYFKRIVNYSFRIACFAFTQFRNILTLKGIEQSMLTQSSCILTETHFDG